MRPRRAPCTPRPPAPARSQLMAFTASTGASIAAIALLLLPLLCHASAQRHLPPGTGAGGGVDHHDLASKLDGWAIAGASPAVASRLEGWVHALPAAGVMASKLDSWARGSPEGSHPADVLASGLEEWVRTLPAAGALAREGWRLHELVATSEPFRAAAEMAAGAWREAIIHGAVGRRSGEDGMGHEVDGDGKGTRRSTLQVLADQSYLNSVPPFLLSTYDPPIIAAYLVALVEPALFLSTFPFLFATMLLNFSGLGFF